MKKGLTYKHVRCRDVAFHVTHSFYVKEKGVLKLKGWWINVANPSNEFPVVQDKITVKARDVKNWRKHVHGQSRIPG